MADWVFWSLLAAMLGLGSLVDVGVFLLQFGLSALLVSLFAALFPTDLEVQAHLFLFASLALLLATRAGRTGRFSSEIRRRMRPSHKEGATRFEIR